VKPAHGHFPSSSSLPGGPYTSAGPPVRDRCLLRAHQSGSPPLLRTNWHHHRNSCCCAEPSPSPSRHDTAHLRACLLEPSRLAEWSLYAGATCTSLCRRCDADAKQLSAKGCTACLAAPLVRRPCKLSSRPPPSPPRTHVDVVSWQAPVSRVAPHQPAHHEHAAYGQKPLSHALHMVLTAAALATACSMHVRSARARRACQASTTVPEPSHPFALRIALT
jgi:hypothetical protein